MPPARQSRGLYDHFLQGNRYHLILSRATFLNAAQSEKLQTVCDENRNGREYLNDCRSIKNSCGVTGF